MSLAEDSFQPRNSRVTIINPVDPNTLSQMRTQDLRRSLQQRIADYGSLQNSWNAKETDLSTQCESMIATLKDTKRYYAAEKAARRAKHLKTIDQMIRTHQDEVMRLETQISDAVNNYDDVDETLALDNEIENLRTQVKCLESEPVPKYDFPVTANDAKVSELEDRLTDLQGMLDTAIREREHESREAPRMLQELAEKNQKVDTQNQKELLKYVEELNKLEREHAEQVMKAKTAARELTKQLAINVKRANSRAASAQLEVTQRQKEKKRQMRSVMEQAADLRMQLQAITERQQKQMAESFELARKCQDERREYVELHKELEMLNAELARETVEHETLMGQLTRIDKAVLNQMSFLDNIRF